MYGLWITAPGVNPKPSTSQEFFLIQLLSELALSVLKTVFKLDGIKLHFFNLLLVKQGMLSSMTFLLHFFYINTRTYFIRLSRIKFEKF